MTGLPKGQSLHYYTLKPGSFKAQCWWWAANVINLSGAKDVGNMTKNGVIKLLYTKCELNESKIQPLVDSGLSCCL